MPSRVDQLEQTFVDFELRPIKLAYLVRRDSVEDFVKAADEATSRWGGISELLLPFSAEGEIDRFWLSALPDSAPDYFVQVPNLEPHVIQRLGEQINKDLLPLSAFQHGSWGLHQLSVHSREDLTARRFVVASSRSPVVPISAAGAIREARIAKEWVAMGARLERSASATAMALAELKRTTLIEGTAVQLTELPGSPWISMPAVIWVATDSSWRDALDYWNLRAMMPIRLGRPPTVLLTAGTLRQPRVRLEIQRKILAIQGRSRPDLILISRSISRAELEKLARAVGWSIYRRRSARMTLYGGRRLPPRRGPLSAGINLAPWAFLGGTVAAGQRTRPLVQLRRSNTILVAASPVTFSSGISGSVRARFSGPPEFSIPSGSSAPKLFHDKAVPARNGFEIEVAPAGQYDFRLNVAPRGELLRVSLEDRGVSFSPSDKGLLATGVIQLIADLEIVRRPNVLGVIGALTTHRVAYDLKALQKQFAGIDKPTLERLAQRLQNVRQEARTLDDIASLMTATKATDVGSVLEQLVDAGAVMRGFRADCVTCGQKNFLEVSQVRSQIECPGCGTRSGFVLNRNRNEPVLYYRLNAMVDRASDNGVLAHLVAVAALLRRDGTAHIVPGADLRGLTSGPVEADLLGLLGPEIWFGEAKSSSALFTSGQIERDIKAATEVGAAHYLMACLEPVGLESIAAAQLACKNAGIALWTLQGAVEGLAEVTVA